LKLKSEIYKISIMIVWKEPPPPSTHTPFRPPVIEWLWEIRSPYTVKPVF